MAVYSVRLADGNESGAGSGVAFTGASGFVTVVRCISLVLFPGTTFGGLFRSASVAYLGGAVGVGALVVAVLDLRQVIEAGEAVEWQFQGGGGTYAVSGYQLDI